MPTALAQDTAAAPTIGEIVAHELRPLVRRIDEEGLYPESVMRSLGAAGAFAHHTLAPDTQGSGLSAAVDAMAEVAGVCVTTAFCVWCQDALGWYLAQSDNPAPRDRYLADVASGRQLGGTGLSNAMKAFSGIEPLALKGRKAAGGYQVTGRLPFVSNVQTGSSCSLPCSRWRTKRTGASWRSSVPAPTRWHSPTTRTSWRSRAAPPAPF